MPRFLFLITFIITSFSFATCLDVFAGSSEDYPSQSKYPATMSLDRYVQLAMEGWLPRFPQAAPQIITLSPSLAKAFDRLWGETEKSVSSKVASHLDISGILPAEWGVEFSADLLWQQDRVELGQTIRGSAMATGSGQTMGAMGFVHTHPVDPTDGKPNSFSPTDVFVARQSSFAFVVASGSERYLLVPTQVSNQPLGPDTTKEYFRDLDCLVTLMRTVGELPSNMKQLEQAAAVLSDHLGLALYLGSKDRLHRVDNADLASAFRAGLEIRRKVPQELSRKERVILQEVLRQEKYYEGDLDLSGELTPKFLSALEKYNRDAANNGRSLLGVELPGDLTHPLNRARLYRLVSYTGLTFISGPSTQRYFAAHNAFGGFGEITGTAIYGGKATILFEGGWKDGKFASGKVRGILNDDTRIEGTLVSQNLYEGKWTKISGEVQRGKFTLRKNGWGFSGAVTGISKDGTVCTGSYDQATGQFIGQWQCSRKK